MRPVAHKIHALDHCNASPMFIRHLNIEVTRQCNQRCFYCFNESGPWVASATLTVDDWLRIIGDQRLNGLRSIHITGGEPFVWDGTISLLSHAQNLRLNTSILSNGFRIHALATKNDQVFRHLTVAQISLDTMDSAFHDSRRGVSGAWNAARGAIDILQSLNVPVEISCVVSDDNLRELPRMADFCHTQGLQLILRPLAKLGRARSYRLSTTFRSNFSSVRRWLQSQYRHVLTHDRFLYVPAPGSKAGDALPLGFATASPDGVLRHVRQTDVRLGITQNTPEPIVLKLEKCNHGRAVTTSEAITPNRRQ